MLAHTWQLARTTAAQEIVVATDDRRIESFCQIQGIRVLMTSPEHESGTDRVAEVADQLDWPDDAIVVCLQADEPATPSIIVDQVAANLGLHPDASIATLCASITRKSEYLDSDRVKVVFDASGYALYFSRSPIPHRRDSVTGSEFPEAYVHIGMYAYRCAFLRQFQQLQPHRLEQEEKLEQLRALANGFRIHVEKALDVPAHGVDRPEDVAAIEKILLDR